MLGLVGRVTKGLSLLARRATGPTGPGPDERDTAAAAISDERGPEGDAGARGGEEKNAATSALDAASPPPPARSRITLGADLFLVSALNDRVLEAVPEPAAGKRPAACALRLARRSGNLAPSQLWQLSARGFIVPKRLALLRAGQVVDGMTPWEEAALGRVEELQLQIDSRGSGRVLSMEPLPVRDGELRTRGVLACTEVCCGVEECERFARKLTATLPAEVRPPPDPLTSDAPLNQQWRVETVFDAFMSSVDAAMSDLSKKRALVSSRDAAAAAATGAMVHVRPTRTQVHASAPPGGLGAGGLAAAGGRGDAAASGGDADVLGVRAEDEKAELEQQQASMEEYLASKVDPTDERLALEEAIRIRFCAEYAWERVWDDAGSGSPMNLVVWRPRVPDSLVFFGDYALVDAGDAPPQEVMAVAHAHPTAFEAPRAYALAWACTRTKRAAYFWVPVPASPEFVALGTVCTLSASPPPLDLVRCVHVDYLRQERQGFSVRQWSAAGGRCAPLSLWKAIGVRTFWVSHRDDAPPRGTFWLFNETGLPTPHPLHTRPVVRTELYGYELVWSDKGTGAVRDVSVWRPRVQDGFVMFGDFAHPGAAQPVESSEKALVAEDHPGFRLPAGFRLVWQVERAKTRVWFWAPVPPHKSFHALGCVATLAPEPPEYDLVRCVHESLLRRGAFELQPWNSQGAARDVGAMWAMPDPVRCVWVTAGSHRFPAPPAAAWTLAAEASRGAAAMGGGGGGVNGEASLAVLEHVAAEKRALELLDECVDELRAAAETPPPATAFREALLLLAAIFRLMEFFRPPQPPEARAPASPPLAAAAPAAPAAAAVGADSSAPRAAARSATGGPSVRLSNSVLQRVSQAVDTAFARLRPRVLGAVEQFLSAAARLSPLESERAQRELAAGLHLLDVLPGAARRDVLALLCGRLVAEMRQVFASAAVAAAAAAAATGGERASAEDAVSRRVAWFQRWLAQRRETGLFGVVPPHWQAEAALAEAFCREARQQLRVLLAALSTPGSPGYRRVSSAELLAALRECRETEAAFERDLSRAAAPSYEASRRLVLLSSWQQLAVAVNDAPDFVRAQARGSGAGSGDDPGEVRVIFFTGALADAFEGFLAPYIADELAPLREAVERVRQGAERRHPWEAAVASPELLAAAQRARPLPVTCAGFSARLGESVRRCAGVAAGRTLAELASEAMQVVRAYIDALSEHVVRHPAFRAEAASAQSSPLASEIATVVRVTLCCLLANATHHVSAAARAALELARDRLVDDEHADLIAWEPHDEWLLQRLGRALKLAGRLLAEQAREAVGAARGVAWGRVTQVADVSPFARSVSAFLSAADPNAAFGRAFVLLMPPHFAVACEAAAAALLTMVAQTLASLDAVGGEGARQLLLDVQTIRDALAQLPVTVATFKKNVRTLAGPAEGLLKDSVVHTFHALLPGGSSRDLATVLRLRGAAPAAAALALEHYEKLVPPDRQSAPVFTGGGGGAGGGGWAGGGVAERVLGFLGFS